MDPLPGYFQDLGQAVYIVPSRGGKPKALTGHDGVITALRWSPDGAEVGFVVTGQEDHKFMQANLCVVDRRGVQRTVVSGQVIMGGFFWCCGGRQLAYVAAPHNNLARQMQLFTVDAEGGRPRSRTAKLNLAVNGFMQINSPAANVIPQPVVTADGTSAYVSVSDGGCTHIYRVPLKGREGGDLVVGGARINALLGGNAEQLLLAVQDTNTPPELMLHDVQTGKEQQRSNHNSTWQSKIRWPELERVAVTSSPGIKIEGWVLKPRHVRPPYKTILYIHGGPHAAFGNSFNADFHELVGAGYAVAYANPRGSVGYGDDFSTAIIGCWGELEERDFAAFLNKLVRLGIAHKDRLGVTGVSGGGHLSGWLIGQTHRFKAAVPEQGLYNMFSMWAALTQEKRSSVSRWTATRMPYLTDIGRFRLWPTRTSAEPQPCSFKERTMSVVPWDRLRRCSPQSRTPVAQWSCCGWAAALMGSRLKGHRRCGASE